MPKNQLSTVGKKNQFVEITTVLRDPGQKAKLQNYIDEVVRCKTKILDENESIKTIRDAAIEELNIEPKMFNSLVSLFFNNNFEQKREELEKLEAAINALMQTGDA
jgi:uncharacterized coiled-coil DUF342 family protein